MKTPLHIAPGLSLPLDAVTQTIAVIGIRGSGKTNTGVVISEELLGHGQQVVILDPVDVWWGLKSSKDGKAPAFSIPIIGGEHGDVPLEGSGGVIIADFVVDNSASAIISLRHLSMNEQRRFATDFARRLYERKGTAEFRSPMMLVVDEADEFMPQRIPSGHEAMFGAFDRIARRGRSSGLGMLPITQRPQVLNKDILTQMEVLIAHRVLHKLDRAALEAWIEAHDTEDRRGEFMASLASLERGDAWVWSPSWLSIFQRVHIRARNTFDSSGTPAAGQRIAPPKKIAEVDLANLGAELAKTIETAKANDPRELKKQLAEARAKIDKLETAIGPRVKTFQEALGAVVITERPDASVTERVLQMGRVAARLDRVRDLLTEVHQDERLRQVLIAYSQVSCCQHHAMLNAFDLGLQVGMEMEKSETGGIAEGTVA